MTYALSRLVSIWMSLYYNLPSLKLWHNESGKHPTINESLDYLGDERYRSNDASLYRKVRTMFNRLHEFNCKNTISLLEATWKNALLLKSISFSEPVNAVSLIDFPRYLGASWPHNDVAVYFPELKKTAIMKISDSRFRPLREKLIAVTQGLDPFIGTAFSIKHSKLHPTFNRVRCSRAIPIDLESFRKLESFNEQLAIVQGAFIETSELRSLLQGISPLSLGKYIIARYSNTYALMQFVTSEAVLKYSRRHNDYNYTFKLDVDGVETSAWMFRNAFFDPVAEPNSYVGKKVRLSGFILIGRSVVEDYRASTHVISIAPADDIQVPLVRDMNDRENMQSVSIRTVEEELLDLNKRIYQTKEEILSEEDAVEHQVVSEDTRKLFKPQVRLINESELTTQQGRTLVIISSNRNRGFTLGEILRRLKYESGIDFTSESVRNALQQLCDKELIFLNIFGDAWYINPSVKVVPSNLKLSPEGIEPLILDYLQKIYPRKLSGNELMRVFFRDDSRITPPIVSKALSRLRSAQKILNNKYKYCWNPYPPKNRYDHLVESRKISSSPQHAYRNTRIENQRAPVLHLKENDIDKIPETFYVQQGGTINVVEKSGIVKKHIVYNFEYSSSMLRQLIADIKRGRYSGFEFTDYLAGSLKVQRKDSRIEATYTNPYSDSVKFITEKLR